MPPSADPRRWQEPSRLGIAYAALEIDGRVQHVHLQDLAALAIERAAPVRGFPSWPGKRYYEGRYASSTTRAHVPFESLYEKTALMVLDRDPAVVGISSQPMWLFWPEAKRERSHAPDFFVRLASGDGVVVDVRPRERIDEKTAEVFALTEQLCGEAGFGYRVICDLSRQLARNLVFLARFRADAFRPSPELIEAVSAHELPAPMAAVAVRLGADLATAMGWLYWMAWWGLVEVDLELPLSLQTMVQEVVVA